MPQIVRDQLQFIHLCDPTRVVDERARTLAEAAPSIAAEQFRGGTQAIVFDGGWLALIHEVTERDKQRYYQHRFVWFDSSNRLRRVSRPFYFIRKGVEFAAGLVRCSEGKGLIISFGVGDSEAWIATVEASDVRRLLEDGEELPSGALKGAVPSTTVTSSRDTVPLKRESDGQVVAKRQLRALAINRTPVRKAKVRKKHR